MIQFFIQIIVPLQAQTWDYLTHGGQWETQGTTFYSSCFNKKLQQSPIDLTNKYVLANEDNTYFFPQYYKSQVKVLEGNFNGLVLSVVDDTNLTKYNLGAIYTTSGDGISVSYLANEVYFRSESEHTIDGHRASLEIQIFHRFMFQGNPSFETNKTAVSILFDLDETAEQNLFLQKIIENYESKTPFEIDLSEIVPKSVSIEPYYFYHGSLTYPYCTQKTQWIILETIRKIPKSQIDFFYNLYHNNPYFKGEGNYRKSIYNIKKSTNNTSYWNHIILQKISL
ncbi:hypothetical protein pb186bvf_000705 [Paramecium bursaria]